MKYIFVAQTKGRRRLLVATWSLTLSLFSANAFANCIGYSGPGGPCYTGPGGGLYTGPGGGAWAGWALLLRSGWSCV
jgi:hypothetical protein